MNAYSEILKLLTRLSASELNKLTGAIKGLLGFNRPRDGGMLEAEPAPVIDQSNERWLLDAIVIEAERHGEHTSTGMLQKSTYIADFRRRMPGLLKFLSQNGQLNRNEQRALMRLAVRLWYQRQHDMQHPAGARQFLQQGNVPAIINLNFPGYVRAGLVKLIISKGGTHVR